MEETWEQDGARGASPGLIESLWRYRLLIVAVTGFAAVAGYLYSSLQPTRYRADATLILEDRNSTVESYLANQVQLITSTPVLERTSQLLNSEQPVEELSRAVDVKPTTYVGTVTISATAKDPRTAATMANAVAEAYQQVTSQRASDRAQRAIAKLEAMRANLPPDTSLAVALQMRAQELAIEAAVYGSDVELLEAAREPKSPTQPELAHTLLAGALGMLAAGVYAWWAAGRDQRVDGRDDPARVLEAPLLGEVPEYHAPRLAAGEPIPSPSMLGPLVADAYRFIVASLEHALSSLGGSSVVVTSVAPGDGKTSAALNIAIAAHQEHHRVVLVDADERIRCLSELCGQYEGPGLTDLSNEAVEVEEYLHPLELADGGSVSILRGGTQLEHPTAFFRSLDFRKALLRIGEQADLVLIDTPPLGVADTIAIADQADGIVLVVNRDVPLSDLRSVRERLAFVGTPLIGYILNRSSASPVPTPASTAARARRASGSVLLAARPARTPQVARREQLVSSRRGFFNV